MVGLLQLPGIGVYLLLGCKKTSMLHGLVSDKQGDNELGECKRSKHDHARNIEGQETILRNDNKGERPKTKHDRHQCRTHSPYPSNDDERKAKGSPGEMWRSPLLSFLNMVS